MGISACIITFNNERTIERCLKSLAWVDEIVVVDSFSTDSTYDTCKEYAHRLEQREWPGFRDQYSYATSLAENDWIIFVDADEDIPPPLSEEIVEAVSVRAAPPLPPDVPAPSGAPDGFIIYRHSYYLGRWIRYGGWNPDREIRLYKKGKGSWTPGLHSTVAVEGEVGTLKNVIHHYNYKDLSDQLRTIDRYSEDAARDMKKAGKRCSVTDLVLRPVARFFRDYFIKRGFRDGRPGLIIALATSFYVFTKYAKLWELGNVKENGGEKQDGG